MVTTPGPGLDLAALRALRTPSTKSSAAAIADITARIGAHLAAHDGYVAFSGGKDSLVVLDLVRLIEPDVPMVFFDSGLDYPETYDYLTELADRWRLDLHRIRLIRHRCRCSPSPDCGTTPHPPTPQPRRWICTGC